MSGAKRKTKYRKHVENDILEGLPEPAQGQVIVQVVELRGGNMIEVRNEQGDQALCILPAKFRKLVWVKRGNFMIASYSDEEYDTASGKAGKVKYTVVHILFKEQIKHLQKQGLWPEGFIVHRDEEQSASQTVSELEQGLQSATLKDGDNGNAREQEESDSDIDSESDLFVNRNRQVEYVSSSEEESDEE